VGGTKKRAHFKSASLTDLSCCLVVRLAVVRVTSSGASLSLSESEFIVLKV
jgi:hypothetical protein